MKYEIQEKQSRGSKWTNFKSFPTREAAQSWIDMFDDGGGMAVLRIVEINK